MFFRSEGYSTLQQPEIWERFFAGATNNRSVVAFINHGSQHLPKYVDASFTKPKAQHKGGFSYIHAFLRVSKLLIDEYEATGVILLTGGVIPLKCFDNFFDRIHPFLQKGASILPEYITTDPIHVERFYQVKKPAAVTLDAWGVHPDSGYIAHQSLITLVINWWDKISHDLKKVKVFEEHYLSYAIRGALNPDSGHPRSALRIYQLLDRRSLLYVEWNKKNPDGSGPFIWKNDFPVPEIDRLRKDEYFFVQDIDKSCTLNTDYLMKCLSRAKAEE